MKKRLQLSKEQRASVSADENTLIIAGPGSGKTTTLTALVASWAESFKKEDILALTFTNKAAREMRNRIEDLMGADNMPTITTFHSYAIRALRSMTNKKLIIWDADDAEGMWKSLCGGNKTLIGLYQIYEFAGNFRPEEEADIVKSKCVPDTARKYWDLKEQYLALMRDRQAYDFNQMIQAFVRLAKKGKHKHYRRIAVDEYQDTSYIQYEMLRTLKKKTSVVYAVGDGDQMLYHWRGANPDNIEMFIDHFKPRIVKLQDNYRSGTAICDLCNNLIGNNEKRIAKVTNPVRKFAGLVTHLKCQSEHDEANQIVRSICEANRQGYSWNDIVVLVRNGMLIHPIIEAVLREKKVPYQIVSAFSFFQRKEVRAVISLMKYMYNNYHTEGLLEFGKFFKLGLTQKRLDTLSKPITPDSILGEISEIERPKKWQKTLLNLANHIDMNMRPNAKVDAMIGNILNQMDCFEKLDEMDEKDETERRENVCILIGDIISNHPTLEAALDEISLCSARDSEKEEESVKLMTIHAAKGLEWPVVHITGLEEGVLPSKRSIEEDGDDESERRVFFVGCSRAEKILKLYSVTRRRYPRGCLQPSRFLKEINIRE